VVIDMFFLMASPTTDFSVCRIVWWRTHISYSDPSIRFLSFIGRRKHRDECDQLHDKDPISRLRAAV